MCIPVYLKQVFSLFAASYLSIRLCPKSVVLREQLMNPVLLGNLGQTYSYQ